MVSGVSDIGCPVSEVPDLTSHVSEVLTNEDLKFDP